jgi:hypothetical protein
MNDIVKQVQQLELPSIVRSYTLFESNFFNHSKHVKPFNQYLDSLDDDELNSVLVFRTEAFSYIERDHPGINVIEVPQHDDYLNHLYRYVALFSSSETIICLGTDEPLVYPDFARCMSVARIFNYHAVFALMENHPKCLVGGRCAFLGPSSLRLAIAESSLDFLNDYPSLHSTDWNCDQLMLTDLIEYSANPVVFNAPAGVFKAATQRFFSRRLETAPTIIVREPNRYDI